MASQSPEPALPDQKSAKPAEPVETDARNGTDEVNGHTSPMDVVSQPNSPVAPTGKENGDTNGTEHEKSQDALTTKSTADAEAPKPERTEAELAQSADKEVKPEKPSADDTEMADAEEVQSPVVTDANETVPAATKDPEVASLLPDVADKSASRDAKLDIDMGDGSPTAAVPSSAEPTASTQDTAVSEPPVETPGEDLNLHPARMSSLAIDATPASPAPATTADTSMSDPPQTGVKVARDREEDDEDQPAAKRVKTDTPSDSVEVKTGPVDAIAVKDGAEPTSLYKPDGRPKNLADPSLDGNEITRYQSIKIRGILAGIKKTKAGVNFKSPVSTMWPLLWEDYRLKVSEPTDISTMEKRLKGAGDPDFPPYPNMGAFKRDLELIYQNSLTFNGPIHNVTAQAKTVWEQVLERMASVPAVETAVEEKKTAKQHPTRHAEPRATAQPSPAQPPRRPSKPAVPSPVDKTAPSPAYAIPPNNHGVPLIRRDSTKNVDDRPKRPVHPPKSKDFGYDVKKKNKLPLELRFCREVLDELVKGRHHDINQFFMVPVDPVALQIPNYYKIIKKPMDLQTMGEKLNHGQYNNAREFERDFQQIVKNAVMFNGPDHVVTHCAQQLDEIFKEEWAKKDAWMAKRAPASAPQASSTASRIKHEEDSDEEDADSDEEEEQKPRDTTTPHLEALQRRLKEEQDKLNELMIAKVPDINMVEVSQSMIAVLQKQVIQERQKLAEAPPPKKSKKAQQTAAKAKKPSGGTKKATAQAAGSSGGGAPGKKAGGGPKKKRHMGAIEKEVIGAAIPELDGTLLERAIDIIKKDTNQNENDSGELELDIEALSQDALTKLYDLSIKNFPNLRAEKEAEVAAAAPPPVPEPVSKPKTSKPKKNKPMGKAEQEARLRQLSDLKAAIKGRGSNSQEPIESIEGNGGASAAHSAPVYESEEEESSEEE
ncbi:hypothetical protein BR93DRAFT_883993 [Coniochaeta sp. PMI_546]|nr:hypothetical protein BR93DRAFT_883993 [Coniochaeta sp. PMI_546]